MSKYLSVSSLHTGFEHNPSLRNKSKTHTACFSFLLSSIFWKKVKTIGCWWRADTNRGRDRKIEWNMTWICAPKECASVRPSFFHPSHVKQDEWLTISRMIWKNSSPLAYILHRREQHNKPINKRFFFADNWTDSAWRVQEGIDDDNDDGDGDDHVDGAAKRRI